MSYTPESLLTSVATNSRGAWVDVLARHGAADAEQIVMEYFTTAAWHGLNADLALAQACLECAYFTDWKWVELHNPCGLGITDRSVPGANYGAAERGILAHLQHLCCYVYTASTCRADHAGLLDPRHSFHDGRPRLADLIRPERKWANPGTDYVASICRIASDVTGGFVGVAAPFERTHWSADIGPGRALADVRWFVVHDTEGHFAGDESVLSDAAAPVESAHFLVGREPGQCIYMVPLVNTAWTAGNDLLGGLAVQVELSKAPEEDGYTDYQYEKLAQIYRWSVQEGMTGVPPVYLGLHPRDDNNGPLPDDAGIIGHAGVPNPNAPGQWGGVSGHTDPGPSFDWERFVGDITGVPIPVEPAAPSVLKFDDRRDPYDHTVVGVSGGILRLYTSTPDRLQAFGFPLANEHQYDVHDGATLIRRVVCQEFERATFEYNPDPAVVAGRWDVTVLPRRLDVIYVR